LVFSERAGKSSERCTERIYAFRPKEEEKPYGKEKGTDKEKSADKKETAYKEESTGKETERHKVHWEGNQNPSEQASHCD
jgi:hypothetical protein